MIPSLNLILNSLIIVMLLGIGFVVLVQNSKVKLNRIFFIFVVFLSLWLLSNYYSNSQVVSLTLTRTANHLVLFFSAAALIHLTQFVGELTESVRLNKYLRPITIGSYLIAATALTPLVVAGVEQQDRVYAIDFGPLAVVFFLLLIFHASIALATLLYEAKQAKGSHRSRIFTILWSLGAMTTVIFTTNVAIPVLTGIFTLTNVGPFATAILVLGIAHSIIRYRLFNIRLIVARSVGYLFSLTFIGFMYALISFFILNRIFFGEESIGTAQELAFTGVALLIAFSFQPLKKFFDRISDRIFYRDAYDPQGFLDELNQLLVSTVDIENLLKGSASIIERHLKSSSVSFLLRETTYFGHRVIGTHKDKIVARELDVLDKTTWDMAKKVIVLEEIDHSHPRLAAVLRDHDVAVAVRLITAFGQQTQGVGYLLLGAKKSGNPYTAQDLRILEIIGNEMVITTQNALRVEEIESFNITLQGKIDDATKQLRQTNEKLQSLDETKDEFISMASHQLRTPLTAVKGYLSMVLEGDAGNLSEMQRRLLDQAYVSSQRMVYLIADLLNVSRLKTGRFVIDPGPTNLADVIEGEIAQLTQTAKSRGLKLSYKKPKNFPNLMLDETKIRQVIMNFIDNAIYYTPTGGSIKVELTESPRLIDLKVIDTGIGIPKSGQHHVFTKFYRANNAKKARPDGTGLGLFMAKKVIIAQGGNIYFDSREDKGSTFGFSFAKSKIKVPESSQKSQ